MLVKLNSYVYFIDIASCNFVVNNRSTNALAVFCCENNCTCNARVYVIQVRNGIILALGKLFFRTEYKPRSLSSAVVNKTALGNCGSYCNLCKVYRFKINHSSLVIKAYQNYSRSSVFAYKSTVFCNARALFNNLNAPLNSRCRARIFIYRYVLVARFKRHLELLCLGSANKTLHLSAVVKYNYLEVGVAENIVCKSASKGHAGVPCRVVCVNEYFLICVRFVKRNVYRESALAVSISGNHGIAVKNCYLNSRARLGNTCYYNTVAREESATLRGGDEH